MMRTAIVVVSLFLMLGCDAAQQRIYDAEQDGRISAEMSQAEVEAIVGRPPDDVIDSVARYDDVLEWTPYMQRTGGHGRLYTFRIKGGKLDSMSVRDDGNSWLAIKKRSTEAPGAELGPAN